MPDLESVCHSCRWCKYISDNESKCINQTSDYYEQNVHIEIVEDCNSVLYYEDELNIRCEDGESLL